MQRDDREQDDDAWRLIVENYGERAELEAEPAASPGPAAEAGAVPEVAPTAPPEPDPDRFVPPDPPLPPRPSRDRLVAWAGVAGSPLVVLLLVVTGLGLPPLLAYALAAAFVGGFVYLVLHLPRSPEDPWDDGARV